MNWAGYLQDAGTFLFIVMAIKFFKFDFKVFANNFPWPWLIALYIVVLLIKFLLTVQLN